MGKENKQDIDKLVERVDRAAIHYVITIFVSMLMAIIVYKGLN